MTLNSDWEYDKDLIANKRLDYIIVRTLVYLNPYTKDYRVSETHLIGNHIMLWLM